MSLSIKEILRSDIRSLETSLDLDAGSARVEVQCLLQAVLRVNRAYLLAHLEQLLNREQHTCYAAMFERRRNGEPIAYILGEREFFGINFIVSPATLIPRHDTELLVELSLKRIPQTPREKKPFRILELGTGSGSVALSIAHARPDTEITAVDSSLDALQVAQANVQRLGINTIRLMQSDWFSALRRDERFDMIVSNPPYIALNDSHLSKGDLRFEPRSALVSGADGLDDIRRIIGEAQSYLQTGGGLLLEHGYDHAERVRVLLQQASFGEVFSARDLSGVERVSGGSIVV
jgi:release factor glutamine methyltransferase